MTPASYHLTPRSLVGRRFAPDTFKGIRVALVGYCPPPPAFGRYARERVRDQHFIHLSLDSVRIVSHDGLRLLSLVHVYGGPVSSATVEELAYYGIDHVLAYGLAGSLGVGVGRLHPRRPSALLRCSAADSRKLRPVGRFREQEAQRRRPDQDWHSEHDLNGAAIVLDQKIHRPVCIPIDTSFKDFAVLPDQIRPHRRNAARQVPAPLAIASRLVIERAREAE